MKAAIDTNLLIYCEQVSPKQPIAQRLLVNVPAGDVVLPVQVCGESYNVLTRKLGVARSAALALVDQWRTIFLPAATTDAAMGTALQLSISHRLSIWDAVILAVAAEEGCELLITEDLHEGFRWRGVTVVNPFREPRSPLLDAFLSQKRA